MDEEEGEGKQEEEGEDLVDRGEGQLGEDRGEDDDPPPPPPPEQEKELLFLIEFLVETLKVMQENMNVENIDPCSLQGPARLALTFLHFPPFLLNEKDLDPDKLTGGDEVNFNCGKSLMFALTEGQFEDTPSVFLKVQAEKEMPHAFRFPSLPIGKTKIQLSELFKRVFEKYDEQPGKTVSKSVKDKYELIGEKGKPAGEVTIYIRLTCLGENIVTEFGKADDMTDTLLFKSKESRRVYECREMERPDDEPGMTLPGWGNERRPKECLPPRPPPSPPDPEDENFEEIFAEINGSAVLVKVEKSARKLKREFHVSEFCDCNIPLPQHLVAGLSDLSLSPASEGSIEFTPSGAPAPLDKRVGLDNANQLMFPVPPVETLSRPGTQNTIQYNVKTCNDATKHGHQGQSTFRVIKDNNPEGPPPKMPNDPEKDVFVLRIIKRIKRGKTRDVLEMEFKTPKEKIVPPPLPPYLIDKTTVTEKLKKKGRRRK